MGVFSLKKGQSAKIVRINVFGPAAERLSSLGVIRGQNITVLGFSLFSGSILILCGYTKIAIAKSIAERIEAEPV